MQPTVVILLSDKRSGSTIFQSEFLSHPDVRGMDYSSHTYLESHHWLKAAVMLGVDGRLFSGGRVYPNYGSARNARTYMIDTLCGNLPAFVPPKDNRALVFDGWEALCAHHARPVFFEKSPQVLAHWAALSVLLEWVARTRFRVKLIGLVRNPMAVQHSSERLFGTAPEHRQFGWLEIHRNLLTLRQMLPADQFTILRHEDILADPQAGFAGVCDFVGLPRHAAMGAAITDATQDRWRADPDYRMRLAAPVAQVARALGYSDAELDNPHAVPEGISPPPFRPNYRPLGQLKNRLRDRVIRPMRMRRRMTHQ